MKYPPVLNPNSPKYGTKEYYDLWYKQGKAMQVIAGTPTSQMSSISKAITPWDPPASPYGVYFDSAYSAEIESYVLRDTSVARLLRKETFQRLGDSWKYYETDVDGVVGVDGASTPYASGSVESGPTFVALEQFKPAYIVDPWETDFTSDVESEWQPFPNNDKEWLRQYHAEKLPNALDVMLTLDIDALANDGSSNLNVESIARICSKAAEATTTYCSSAADPDIHWGKSTALIDRDADTDDTFGGGAGSGIDIPGSAAARVLNLDMIDDAFAASLDYANSDNYIMITGARTINEISSLIDPKQRFVDGPMDVQYTVNGVQTRRGTDTGFSVASFISNGIRLPIFPNKHVSGEGGRNITTKITDADIGDIYILNMDDIHLRYAVPSIMWSTPPEARMTGDIMKDRHMIMTAVQLICTNFRSQSAVKYLKKS